MTRFELPALPAALTVSMSLRFLALATFLTTLVLAN